MLGPFSSQYINTCISNFLVKYYYLQLIMENMSEAHGKPQIRAYKLIQLIKIGCVINIANNTAMLQPVPSVYITKHSHSYSYDSGEYLWSWLMVMGKEGGLDR